MANEAFFSPQLFGFLRELRDNNERDWFDANRERYERYVRDDSFEFIAAFSHLLPSISGHFDAIPRIVGGSLFRIHRDVRFSKDKSPFKTHVGIHFRHRRHKDVHAPGFYLHLEPRNCFLGVGVWRPDGAATKKIRSAIAAPRSQWTRAVGGAFAEHFELAGEQLKRIPRGFDAEHARADDLRRKSFLGVSNLRQGEVTSSDFLALFAERCKQGASLNRFLCRALDLEF